MWHKNLNAIGVRRKAIKKEGDKRQTGPHCFSFGASSGLTKEELRGHAYICLKKLDDGMTELAVRAWVDAQMPVGF